jgi:hypothetical protein
MRKEYDFSKMKGRKNPYAKRLKKQVPYQNLINLYLRDCVQSGRKISIKWVA